MTVVPGDVVKFAVAGSFCLIVAGLAPIALRAVPRQRSPALIAGAVRESAGRTSTWKLDKSSLGRVEMRNGLPLPDPRCTPGAINPITLAVLQDRSFRTGCVRNCMTTLRDRSATYRGTESSIPKAIPGETRFVSWTISSHLRWGEPIPS